MHHSLHAVPALLRQQGPRWILFRLVYALKLRTRWFERRLPVADWPGGFPAQELADVRLAASGEATPLLGSSQAVADAERILNGHHRWFSRHESGAGFPPDWLTTPETTSVELGARRHWSRIDDFSLGDIKVVWELGRFGFVFPLMRAYAFTGDERYAGAFWQAVEDWREKNPPQQGVHWKCGQEIALRLMTWGFGYSVFRDAAETTPQRRAALAETLARFGQRIELNIAYALHQQNNHGVSEAAGLFTAGVLLGRGDWITHGRRLLERLARELIYSDGSFSQHSTNYHRLMLHVYLWVVQLGRTADCALSTDTVERVKKAGWWLRTLLIDTTGRVPNLGANDGAHFLDLTDLDYLDFRPTVQAVGLVTEGRRWLSTGPWDELARWLGAESPQGLAEQLLQTSAGGRPEKEEALSRKPAQELSAPLGDTDDDLGSRVENVLESVPKNPSSYSSAPQSRGRGNQTDRSANDSRVAKQSSACITDFAEGGYVVWRDADRLALLRCPRRFRHRPSQCDLLHLDLWHRDHNLLRDAGTYSYNCGEPWQSYFGSSAAHNTIRFDDRDPMPKLSRFLFGHWPRCEVTHVGDSVTAQYRDYRGAEHRRTVRPRADGFRIEDEVSGRFRKATLRWRLCPEVTWTGGESGCSSALADVTVRGADHEPVNCQIAGGWESLYYWDKQPVPVLEVPLPAGSRSVVTEVRLK